MLRKYLFVVAAGAISLGAVALTTTGASASPRKAVTFTGAISCKLAGSLTSTPPLKNGAQNVTFAISAKLSGCTGKTSQGGVKITGGTTTGKVKVSGATCSGLISSPPALVGSVAWTAAGGTATATGFKLSNGDVTSARPVTVTYTSTQTGSFGGKGGVKGVVKQSEGTLLTECGGAGVKVLTLTTGSTMS